MKLTRILACSTALFAVSGLYAVEAADAAVKTNWDNLCAKCHGADGTAATPLGKKLKIKNYADKTALVDHTDAKLKDDILNGVVVNGKEKMKGYKADLKDEDAVALVKLIRSFAK